MIVGFGGRTTAVSQEVVSSICKRRSGVLEVFGELATPVSFHLAMFFPKDTVFGVVRFAASVDEIMKNLFKQEPSILSLSVPDAEVPRLVLDEAGVGTFTVSFSRADLKLRCSDRLGVDDLTDLAERLADLIVSSGISICRVGLIVELDLTQTAVADLRKLYLSEQALTGARKVQLAWLRFVDTDMGSVNRWVRLELPGGEAHPRLIIDTNTLSEEHINLDAAAIRDTLKSWLESIRVELGGIIRGAFTS